MDPQAWLLNLRNLRQRLENKVKDSTDESLTAHLQWRLSRVRHAIEAVETGTATYGICKNCGDPIPEGRLKSYLEAIWCVPCVTEYETDLLKENGKASLSFLPQVLRFLHDFPQVVFLFYKKNALVDLYLLTG